MIRKIILLLFIQLIGFSSWSQKDSIQISVLTVAPGNEVYSVFGHTAIRVINGPDGKDRVYNFGTFNFNTPFFVLKFLRGNLNYTLSVSEYKRFYFRTQQSGRKTWEQKLELSQLECRQISQELSNCYQSECRNYLYEFFFNNCATKVRDYLPAIAYNKINSEFIPHSDESFRDLLNPYVENYYWLDVGVNLALGANGDRIASLHAMQFLPDHLMQVLDNSGFVNDTQVILEGETFIQESVFDRYAIPYTIALVLLILLIYPKTRRITTIVYSSILSLTVVILILLSLFAFSGAYDYNFNIIWLLSAPMLLFLKENKTTRIALQVIFIYTLVLLLLWNQVGQQLSVTFIPWMILVLAQIFMKQKMGLWLFRAARKP